MLFEILITLFSIVGILTLHEFGHFILAKLFKVKVEEFGIGYPPRIFKRKIGDTVYSLNLLPFGAFVKVLGEEGGVESVQSFKNKKIWQRALIALGGVLSFWLMAAIIFSIIIGTGVYQAVEDEMNYNLSDPRVLITYIAPNSPAKKAGLEIGDVIKELEAPGYQIEINKVKDIQNFTNENKGKEVIFTIQRGDKIIEIPLIPRVLPPEGEGPTGIGLTRAAIVKYPWWLAPVKGIEATLKTTVFIVKGLFLALISAIKGLPTGVQLIGPVGIATMLVEAAQIGINYFLQIVGLIAIYLAISNLLPIPIADGGKILFLAIEKIRKKPFSQTIEIKINAIFFVLVFFLMIYVTIQDIGRLF